MHYIYPLATANQCSGVALLLYIKIVVVQQYYMAS